MVGIEYRPRTFQNNQKMVTSQALSEYDVISNFRPLVPSKIRCFHNFLFLNELSSNLTRIQNWMLILIFGSKSGFGDDFGQYDTKTIILHRVLAKRLLEIALPWQHLRSNVTKNYLKRCVIR